MLRVIIIFILLIQTATYSQWYKTHSRGYYVNEIVFYDSLNGIFYGEHFGFDVINIMGKTNDGGENWTITELPSMGEQFFSLSKEVLFSYGNWSKIYRSNNSGSDWTKVFDIGSVRINDLYFINDSEGFLTVGKSIYKTIDSGLNWNEIEIQDSLKSDFGIIHFLDVDTGWVTTSEWPNQAFLWTYDGGITWSKESVPFPYPTYKPCYFVTPKLGYIKVGSNDIYKTSDGGRSWVELNNFFRYGGFVNEIFFVNENVGYVGCEFGTSTNRNYPDVFKTTDGGESWVKIYHDDGYSEGTPVYSLYFINENIGFVASNAGLFKTTTGGITGIDESENMNSITTFNLSQNYPNPFNPSTKISYSILEEGKVELTVFDILGRKIQTLVNKQQSAGSYEIEFDANKLTSGIYFYKLRSGSFTETKKMLLLQ